LFVNTDDIQYMTRAIALAEKGRGMTSPNPIVGAVVVKGGKIVGEGYHRKAGADHAEIVALQKAGNLARKGTLYVSLEPCCHQGLTGPCTTAIIEAGIARVVYAVADTDPRIAGRGARVLKRAGIRVTANILHDEARKINEPHFHFNKTERPFVTLKLAQSLDGCIATKSGDSQWIGGVESRKFVHKLRSEVDAVMVGGETARRDNPQLTVRHVRGRNPFRIVVTASGSLPRGLTMFSKNNEMRTIVACTTKGIKRLGASLKNSHTIFWDVKTKSGGLDMEDLLIRAGQFGFRHILVEGGSLLATSLLKRGLVDRYVAVISPLIIGDSRHSFGDLGVTKVARSVGATVESVERMGEDIVVTCSLEKRDVRHVRPRTLDPSPHPSPKRRRETMARNLSPLSVSERGRGLGSFKNMAGLKTNLPYRKRR
jgi:diaminohydroxyphosphoribosylaminopyrimidine deaminase / 5-amino-6-(5-phosphoribosylamino)uracil reductase